eukprot:scaffold302043_cov116-Cyclotella_meneghiniana.AAC.1
MELIVKKKQQSQSLPSTGINNGNRATNDVKIATISPKNAFDESQQDEIEGDDDEEEVTMNTIIPWEQQQLVLQQEYQQKQLELARSFGLSNPSSQVAYPIVGTSEEDSPRIVCSIRLDDNTDDDGDSSIIVTSNSFAYVIYKPVGWSILGGEKKKKKKGVGSISSTGAGGGSATANRSSSITPEAEEDDNTDTLHSTATAESNNNKYKSSSTGKNKLKRVKAYDEETDEFDYVEYNEADILAVLTPKEREELLKDGGLDVFQLTDDAADVVRGIVSGTEWDDGGYDEEDEDHGGDGTNNVLPNKKNKKETKMKSTVPRMKANILNSVLPSLVAWLKEHKAEEGTPIKGGKNWAAVAGAMEVDDSGLVLLCPRDRLDALHVDRCTYHAVLGNGKKMASRSKLIKSIKSNLGSIGGEMCDDSTAAVEVISRLRRGRDQDPVSTVK